MKKVNRVYCDVCKTELIRVSEEEAENSGEPCGWDWRTAHEHVCRECWDEAFEEAWDESDPCGRCENRPCERGRDCWYEPPRMFAYETYVGEKIETSKAKGERRV